MPLPVLAAIILAASPLFQESVMPMPSRSVLPRPTAGAPIAKVNDNRRAAGTLSQGMLTLSLDVVEAGYQAEGEHDPVVRIFAFAETGEAPTVPGPLLRAPLGTTVHLTVHNRSDSALVLAGLRHSMAAGLDTLNIAAGATRDITFRLDAVGNFFYWAATPASATFGDRNWIDSQLTGAFVVDPAGITTISPQERVWLITEWFYQLPKQRSFESLLTFNGKAWPYNEQLTFAQGDSVHLRVINATSIAHPLHLHGFYFRVSRSGGDRADTAIRASLQPLENMRLVPAGSSVSLSFVPTTPGNWVFHCHLAGHINEITSLHGSPDAFTVSGKSGDQAMPLHDMPGGHTMRGLVVGMHVTPAAGYKPPVAADRRVINLLIQKRPDGLIGGRTAYGFLVQSSDTIPAKDSISIPGPVLELKRGQAVRIQVKNNMDEPGGVHWHGLEIESYPDGVSGFSGMGDKVMQPIPPGGTFAAEFTPPRSGTFPYHSHLHEMRQIGSGMYGAIIVSDAPRDTLRDHVIVAGSGGLPVFYKEGPAFLLVNGSATPKRIYMTVGDTNRIRIVSIAADDFLNFRFGTDTTVARWKQLAKDGADLPLALRFTKPAVTLMGPGDTADFTYVPARAGNMQLEVWIDRGQHVTLPVEIRARTAAKKH